MPGPGPARGQQHACWCGAAFTSDKSLRKHQTQKGHVLRDDEDEDDDLCRNPYASPRPLPADVAMLAADDGSPGAPAPLPAVPVSPPLADAAMPPASPGQPAAATPPLSPALTEGMRSLQVDSDDGEDVLAVHHLQPTLAGLLAGVSAAADRTGHDHTHAHSSADATAEDTTKAEDDILPILQKLSLPDASKLLGVITNSTFRPSDVRWSSMPAVNAFLDNHDDTDWDKVEIHSFGRGSTHKPLYMHIRQDIRSALQTLMSEPGVTKDAFLDPGDERQDLLLYDVRSGKWHATQKAYIHRSFGADCALLPYIIYSDETHVTLHGAKFHPMNISLALPGQHRAEHGYQRVALLPVVEPEQFEMTSADPRFKALQCDVFRKSCLRALEKLKSQSYRAEKFAAGGEELRMVALPATYVADLLEAWKLMGIRATGTMFPDLSCLVPKDKLDDPHGSYPPRTVAVTRQAVKEVLLLHGARRLGAAKAKADEMSLIYNEFAEEPSYLTVLDGFNHTDPFRLIFPDDLHQSMKGDQEHLLDIIGSHLPPRDYGPVNQAIMCVPPFPGLRLPSQGLATRACFGTQRAAMFKVTPVALLAVQSNADNMDLAQRLATTVCACLEFQALRDLEVHTPQTISSLKAARIAFQESAVETLADVKSFKYPKFFNGRKYEEAIEWLGSALFTSASSGEASHKSIKNAYRHTNRQGHHAVDQALQHIRREDVVRGLADTTEEAAKIARSAGQRAKELECPVLTKKATRMCYSKRGDGPEREAFLARCEQQPDLQEHLERSIRLHLAGFPAYNPRDPEATLLCNLPDARGSTVKARAAFAVPYQKHRGAPLESFLVRAVPVFGSSRRPAYDNVAIRADESGSMDGCWFGQVRLIFTMEDRAQRTRECILVRWYDAAEHDERDEHLSGSLRKLRWATTRVDSQQLRPWYDVKLLSDVIKPVLIQEHPQAVDQGTFYYNKFA